MKSNLFVTGLLVVNGACKSHSSSKCDSYMPPFNNNPVTSKLDFTKEKFVHEEIVWLKRVSVRAVAVAVLNLLTLLMSGGQPGITSGYRDNRSCLVNARG